MCILGGVGCEWDPAKARANLAKHGVRFADAVSALEDELALTIRDPSPEEEERWITVGADSFGRVLVVVYTWRGERARLISARPATPHEQRQYEESHEA
ncbi:MAG TPA: BrnT family toxin [Candidatus Acidoferrales bacterium]|nr:BrnT family toxin [Candidatus Acidoferrales bacterium]